MALDRILEMTSRWRAPRLIKLQKSQKPMSGQETIRIFTQGGTIALQLRFIESYGHTNLTVDEARNLAHLLEEAVIIVSKDMLEARARRAREAPIGRRRQKTTTLASEPQPSTIVGRS